MVIVGLTSFVTLLRILMGRTARRLPLHSFSPAVVHEPTDDPAPNPFDRAAGRLRPTRRTGYIAHVREAMDSLRDALQRMQAVSPNDPATGLPVERRREALYARGRCSALQLTTCSRPPVHQLHRSHHQLAGARVHRHVVRVPGQSGQWVHCRRATNDRRDADGRRHDDRRAIQRSTRSSTAWTRSRVPSSLPTTPPSSPSVRRPAPSPSPRTAAPCQPEAVGPPSATFATSPPVAPRRPARSSRQNASTASTPPRSATPA